MGANSGVMFCKWRVGKHLYWGPQMHQNPDGAAHAANAGELRRGRPDPHRHQRLPDP